MSLRSVFDKYARQMEPFAPKGLLTALHIRRNLPLLSILTFPLGWVEHYTAQAYALRDPLIA